MSRCGIFLCARSLSSLQQMGCSTWLPATVTTTPSGAICRVAGRVCSRSLPEIPPGLQHWHASLPRHRLLDSRRPAPACTTPPEHILQLPPTAAASCRGCHSSSVSCLHTCTGLSGRLAPIISLSLNPSIGNRPCCWKSCFEGHKGPKSLYGW